jgi:hypothetical protein
MCNVCLESEFEEEEYKLEFDVVKAGPSSTNKKREKWNFEGYRM